PHRIDAVRGHGLAPAGRRPRGGPVQRRRQSRGPRRRGPQDGSRSQHYARRHHQPRLRPGRGRSGGRQPLGVRGLLRRAPALLHRGQPAAARQRASYFYSRRIGARPSCNASGDFVDCPQNATILGAAKITGRLASGTSLGVLTAVTGREAARTFDTTSSTFGRAIVASPAGYGVARLQQEFGASKSVVGVTLTTVQRDLDSLLAPSYTRHAYAGGADWILRWDRGAYELRGWLGFTDLRGDSAAINRVQRSAVHYFQRPDARYIDYDPSRTSFTGSTALLWWRKTKGNWLYDLQYGWESPAYDPNDAGRLGNADGRNAFAGMIYRQTKPRAWFQNYVATLSAFTEYDFGGDRQILSSQLYGEVTLKNFWDLSSYVD